VDSKLSPEFWIAKGNISFQLSLVQYDTSQANDLFLGSFLKVLRVTFSSTTAQHPALPKDFVAGSEEYIVLYNPSLTQTYKVSYWLTIRLATLFAALVSFEVTLVLGTYICHKRTFRSRNSPLALHKAFWKQYSHPLDETNEANDRGPYLGFGNDRGYRPKKRPNMRAQVPYFSPGLNMGGDPNAGEGVFEPNEEHTMLRMARGAVSNV